MKIFELKFSAKLPHKLSWKMNIKCLGITPHLMPATPIFEKHYFFKNGPKKVTKVENFKKIFCLFGNRFIGFLYGILNVLILVVYPEKLKENVLL